MRHMKSTAGYAKSGPGSADRRTSWAAVAALSAALVVGACVDSVAVGVEGTASIRVLLTDAPIDYVESSMVDIGAVVLSPQTAGSTSCSPKTERTAP